MKKVIKLKKIKAGKWNLIISKKGNYYLSFPEAKENKILFRVGDIDGIELKRNFLKYSSREGEKLYVYCENNTSVDVQYYKKFGDIGI